ncbi:MAG TPA: divalent-cation tolerance protein CutA [Anaerolineales bacterium]
MNSQKIVVLITVPSVEAGRQIARTLLELKLAACVNILPQVHSLYTWQGEIHDDDETLLVVKTRAELFEARLVPAVKAIHPYEVPEIIALPIQAGSTDYLDWIGNVTK